MGYQEYVYKIDNIKKFANKRKAVDKFIDNKCFETVEYYLVEFKEDLANIKKGVYVYTFGDRYISRKFLNYLSDSITGGSSYISSIENALESYYEDNKYDQILKDLFKENSTPFGRVVYKKEPVQENQMERTL